MWFGIAAGELTDDTWEPVADLSDLPVQRDIRGRCRAGRPPKPPCGWRALGCRADQPPERHGSRSAVSWQWRRRRDKNVWGETMRRSNVAGMVRARPARRPPDAAPDDFGQMSASKAGWCGLKLTRADRWPASSDICPACGANTRPVRP